MAFTSDGQDLVAGTDLGFTAVIDVATGQIVRRLSPKGQAVSTGAGDWARSPYAGISSSWVGPRPDPVM